MIYSSDVTAIPVNTRIVTIETSFFTSVGNILWLMFGGGIVISLLYFLFGIFCLFTIVLAPFSTQLFKLAAFSLFPFGKVVSGSCIPFQYSTLPIASVVQESRSNYFGDKLYLVGNILWFPFGLTLFIIHISLAISTAVTIILLPFSLQHLKLAQFALFPFGSFEDNGLTVASYLTLNTQQNNEENSVLYEQIPLAEPV